VGTEKLTAHTSWLQKTEIQEPLLDSRLGQESKALHSPREGSTRKPESQSLTDKIIETVIKNKRILSPNDEHIGRRNSSSYSATWGQMQVTGLSHLHSSIKLHSFNIP
jgi:hypothetical protein